MGQTWRRGQWADRLREVVKYRNDNEHCNLSQRQLSLGKWVSNQQTAFEKFQSGKAASMTPRRLQILNYIGFVWDAMDSRCRWDDDGWMRMFEELIEYKKKHGNCLVPSEYKGNPKLGRWVSAQRKMYHDTKKGKSIRMTKERQHKLEGIGFVWKVMRWKVMR
mmetsp:Transcript_4446/g.6804  ORF Transcript_4446/g.6804 Transcript_4446/m.6804 type:complete len:163 (-) Transcript_4446:49-537(-)